ncbi:type II toxin-antitoxin system VapC family toxin [Persicitalea jodogahamensis]|uniref:Uncharacterized protein n=1 Tax=Persicitalea jodogahamensis TaxID=402147 RepID=A0A8J3D3G5_9BACT|nr:hypothetical protein [Persicitalea jodogahamensis]GHB76421.1 hypothetical protein GCM10007390_32940 [Persicitalea jodogahamensis]
METTVRKPRKRKEKKLVFETEVPEPLLENKEEAPAKPSRKRKAVIAEQEIVFVSPETEKLPTKSTRKRKAKKEQVDTEAESTLEVAPPKVETTEKVSRKRKVEEDATKKDVTTPLVVKEVVTKSPRKRKAPSSAEPAIPAEVSKPPKKKKATQASWDKWVKATVVAVSPDVWNIHASELSHNSQFLTDLRKLPSRVMLDTPALDYLFRCPDRLSHNARLVLNEEGVECLVSLESLREWADKMRAGQYLINKENGFFDKVLDRFDLESVITTTEVYHKYIFLKAPSFVDISWERKPEDFISTRLNADERPTRIIAAQALVLGVPILSPDLRYDAYKKDGLKTVW